jgi:hypothetical protein
MLVSIGWGTSLFFEVWCLIVSVFAFFLVPETPKSLWNKLQRSLATISKPMRRISVVRFREKFGAETSKQEQIP